MADFLLYVDMRLEQWADWFSRDNLFNLNFTSVTIEYRLMNEGCVINSTAPRQFKSNQDAEEIEALVKEIERYNRKVGLALRSRYFLKLPFRERAEKIGLSYSQYKVFLDYGRFWLAGRLSGFHSE